MIADNSASGLVPPVALTMGEPAGVGPEIAAKAFAALQGDVPFFLIGDPRHLPEGVAFTKIDHPAEAHEAVSLPVLPHDFQSPRVPCAAQPEHAQAVIDVIARAVGVDPAGRGACGLHQPDQQESVEGRGGFPFPGPHRIPVASGQRRRCCDDVGL